MYQALTAIAAVFSLTVLHAAFDPGNAAATPAPAPAPSDARQATSLLGKPLFAPPLPQVRRGQMEADLELARRAAEAAPTDEAATIWLGRRLGYLSRFTESLDVYTKGLATHPDSYRLLRHRGHRYITVRKFDLAIADLSKAWDLAKNQPDAPEPDINGAPTAEGPRTTDKSNILYHLGLAHYLKGDFNKAAETLAQRTTLATGGTPLTDDNLVSFLYWHYLSLRRLGRDDDAKALLTAEFRPRMDVRDNAAYHAVLRAFTGDVPAEVLAPASETGQSSNLAMAYGVGMYHLLNNQREEASAMFAKVASNAMWPSFGVIAAEAEIARSATTRVPTP